MAKARKKAAESAFESNHQNETALVANDAISACTETSVELDATLTSGPSQSDSSEKGETIFYNCHSDDSLENPTHNDLYPIPTEVLYHNHSLVRALNAWSNFKSTRLDKGLSCTIKPAETTPVEQHKEEGL